MADSEHAGGRSRGYAAALAVLAAGAVVVLVAYGMTWAIAKVPLVDASSAAGLDLVRSGRDLLPWAAASGWVALAGVAGIVATRSWGRAVVGVVVLLAGVVAMAGAIWFAADATALVTAGGQEATGLETTWAWIAAALGGALVVAAGAAAVVAGRRWPSMGARYERSAPAASTRSAWDLQDLGQDPTDDLVE